MISKQPVSQSRFNFGKFVEIEFLILLIQIRLPVPVFDKSKIFSLIKQMTNILTCFILNLKSKINFPIFFQNSNYEGLQVYFKDCWEIYYIIFNQRIKYISSYCIFNLTFREFYVLRCPVLPKKSQEFSFIHPSITTLSQINKIFQKRK